MIRVVHLFDVKKGVAESGFVEWLDAKLSTAARRFGCVDRKTWKLLDGFAVSALPQIEVPEVPSRKCIGRSEGRCGRKLRFGLFDLIDLFICPAERHSPAKLIWS